MSQPIVINIGALPNDGTGDPLRTAFNDVNLNFANVFTAGPVGSNIRIANNSILTTNTNGNLILNPNGTGVIQGNAHVIPDQTRIRNLGSPSSLWLNTYTQYLNTAYANIGTANIGNIGTLTIAVGNLHIAGGSNGYVLQTDGTGNLTWTAQTGGSGNGTPGGANTQIQFNDANSFGGQAGFTFDKGSNALAVPGDINLTDGTVIQSSGGIQFPSSSSEWDLHSSDNNIYIGALPNEVAYIDTYSPNISVRLRTLGNPDEGPGYDWIFDPTGNLTAPGNIQMGNTSGIYSSSVGYVVGLRMSRTEPSVKLVANEHEWQFNSNGILKLPAPFSSVYPSLTMTDSSNLLISGYQGAGYTEDGGNIIVGGGTSDSGNNGNATVFGQQVTVQTQLNGTSPTNTWTFNADGNLQLPFGNITGAGNIIGPGNISYPFGPGPVLLANVDDSYSSYFSLTGVANATGVLGYMGPAAFSNNAATGLVYTTDGNGNDNSWYFQADGTTAFPHYTFPSVDGANTQVLSTDGSGILYWANAGSASGNSFSAITMTATPSGPSNQIKYGLGNLVSWLDGGWVIGEYNGTVYGTEGIRISPAIEGNVEVNLPSNQDANVNPLSLNNYADNVIINANSNEWKFGGDGSLTPPDQASNQRTGSGLVLKIGDTNNQAIITGPAPVANSYNSAPRLVIAGQDGALNGEGGDIYLWAGQSGPNGGSGGDIKVDGGQGYNGSEGGTVKIRGGYSNGGTAGQAIGGFVEIYAGSGNIGAPVDIQAGQGNSQANSGNITLTTYYGGTWTFDTLGNLTLPSTTSNINYSNGVSILNDIATTGNFVFDTADLDGTAFDEVALTGTNSGNILINADGLVAVLGGYESGGMVSDGGNTYIFNGDPTFANGIPQPGVGYIWQFGGDGELTLPSGGRLGFAGKGWTGLDGGNGNAVSLTSFYANGFYAGCVTNNNDGNIIISTYTGDGLQGNWAFDNGANLVLAPTNTGAGGAGSGESAKLRGTRKIVNGYTNTYAYSTVLNVGGTPTVAYTATDNSVMSVKITFAVEGSTGVWEQFDVSAVIDSTGNNVNFTVSNRVKRDNTIPDTAVTANIDGSDRITISLNLDVSQGGGGWSSFDAVEFGLMAG